MTFDCADLDHLTDSRREPSGDERAARRAHLDGCARCREQVAADAALRLIFSETPELTFSPGFPTTLRRRLSERRLRRSLSPKARGIVLGYAAFTLGSSAWILATIDWDGTTSGRALLGLSLASLAALPLLVSLGRSLAAPRLR